MEKPLRIWLKIPLTLILLAILAQVPARAGEDKNKELVRPVLMADVEAVAPGASFRAGVLFEMEKGWHVFWTNPGDAGLPTLLGLEAQEGFSVSPTRYPAPILFGAGTELSGYGYVDRVLLFADMKAPEHLKGDRVTIKAKTKWLVCKYICIPGKRELSLTLPVAAEALPSKEKVLFDQWSSQVPQAASTLPGLRVTGMLNLSAVAPDTDFEALFVIKAPEGRKIAPSRDKHLPLLIPDLPENYEILRVQLPKSGGEAREEILVRVAAKTFPDEAAGEKIGGVFQLDLVDGPSRRPIRFTYAIDLPRVPAGTAVEKIAFPAVVNEGGVPPTPPTKPGRLPLMLLFAFIGGILLNIMPCVLPVVSIKVLSLVKQAELKPREIRLHGLAYTAGILASFLALAVVVAVAKSGGEAVGWGFQFQSPIFVSVLAAVVFVFGLSLLGVFEFGVPDSRSLDTTQGALTRVAGVLFRGKSAPGAAATTSSYTGSFATGVFATVLATPCTAPFLGVALGFAFSQPIPLTFLIFGLIGLGLAFPFCLLAFVPAWTRFLPKPGDWMVTFKSVMGFLLVATVIWLMDVLGRQVGTAGLTRMMVFLGVLGFSSWLWGRFGSITRKGSTRLAAGLAAAFLAFGGASLLLRYPPSMTPDSVSVRVAGGIPWEPFSEKRLAELSGAGRTVFINFTAAWCWTCKVNEKAVIETKAVKKVLRDLDIAPLKGDWTRRDPEITAYLKRHGRAGVPLYVVVPPGGLEPLILPEIITKEMLIRALKEAGPALYP